MDRLLFWVRVAAIASVVTAIAAVVMAVDSVVGWPSFTGLFVGIFGAFVVGAVIGAPVYARWKWREERVVSWTSIFVFAMAAGYIALMVTLQADRLWRFLTSHGYECLPPHIPIR